MPSELKYPSGLDIEDARRVIEAALVEDVGSGDITSSAVIPEDLRFHGVMRARHDMVIAGLPVAREVFRSLVPDASFRAVVADADAVVAGAILGEIDGPARGLLTAERTAPIADPLWNRDGHAPIRRTNPRDRLHIARNTQDHFRDAQAL
jgi:hypothetical protein